MRCCSFWLYGGKVYVPHTAQAPSGVLSEVEPVDIVAPDLEALQQVLERHLNTPMGRTHEWRPGESEWYVSVAGARSWNAFRRKASGGSLEDSEGHWNLCMGPGADEAELVVLPLETPVAELARRILEGLLKYAR